MLFRETPRRLEDNPIANGSEAGIYFGLVHHQAKTYMNESNKDTGVLLESHIDPACIFLDCGKKLERTHACVQEHANLYIQRPQHGDILCLQEHQH